MGNIAFVATSELPLKPKRFQVLHVLVITCMLVSSCATRNGSSVPANNDSTGRKQNSASEKPALISKFQPKGAVSDLLVFKNVSENKLSFRLNEAVELASGSILKHSPLELVNVGKSPELLQLATKVRVIAYLRKDGEGLDAFLSKSTSQRLPGFSLRRIVTYPDYEAVRRDFPYVPQTTLGAHLKRSSGQFNLTKWTISFYFVLSRDHKSMRIFMDKIRYLDHREPAEDGIIAPRTIPIIALFSYRYPVAATGQLHVSTAVFDLIGNTKEGAYQGRQQSTGWLPLQQNAQDGAYSFQVALVSALNFQTLMEKIGGLQSIGSFLLKRI